MNYRHYQNGFTILELLIALGIVGILAAVAMPGFMETIGAAGVNGASKTLNNTLSLARSEAISRGQDVSICPANTTMDDCSVTSWSNGWIVFIDTNGDATGATGSIDLAGTTPDVIIQTFQPLNDVVVTSTLDLLQYNSRGYGLNGATVTLKICPEDNNASNARSIIVGLAGSARINEGGLTCP